MSTKAVFSKDDALKYRSQGLTHQQIADIMGCSKIWVAKAVQGVPKSVVMLPVDSTKIKAIQILEAALEQLKGL